MSERPMQVDDRMIEDLVDGNLVGEQYRTALRALDSQPERWRDCALAFLEEQALRQELRAMAQSGVAWSGRTVEANSSRRDLETVAVERKFAFAQGPKREGWWHLSTWLSTAALLLLGVTLGWIGSEIAVTQPERQPGSDQIANAPQRGSNNRSASIPLDSVWDQGQLVRVENPLAQRLRELERQGKIRVESVGGFVPLPMDNGSAALVPVEQFRVQPVTLSF